MRFVAAVYLFSVDWGETYVRGPSGVSEYGGRVQVELLHFETTRDG